MSLPGYAEPGGNPRPEPVRITADLPIRAIRVEGELALTDDDRAEIRALAMYLVGEGSNVTKAEADAVEQFAQKRLGSTAFSVEEAEPL